MIRCLLTQKLSVRKCPPTDTTGCGDGEADWVGGSIVGLGIGTYQLSIKPLSAPYFRVASRIFQRGAIAP